MQHLQVFVQNRVFQQTQIHVVATRGVKRVCVRAVFFLVFIVLVRLRFWGEIDEKKKEEDIR